MYLRLNCKPSIFDLQLTVTPLMHLKCPRIQNAGLFCAPDAQKNLHEQTEDRHTQNSGHCDRNAMKWHHAGGTLTDKNSVRFF